MIRVVIIEDEIAAMEQLKILLCQNNELDIEIVETIDSVEDSIDFFRSERANNIDLVFMDIHLSDGYAFSIFNHVEINLPIIFTTAYDEYALKAFEVNCLDYILKPLSNTDIEKIFAKINIIAQYSKSISTNKQLETILVLDGWRTTPLNVNNISFFYKVESKVKAYDHLGKSYQTNMTLEKLEEQLSQTEFIRANRQFIVARSGVQSLESWEGSRASISLNVETPERLIISRAKVTPFKEWLKGN